MNVLVVGAGAIGGYLAARMMEAGADVTLLVRERRKRQLLKTGLTVQSASAPFAGHPKLLVSGEPAHGAEYDLAVLAMKASGLKEALLQLKPYLSEKTAILPFLNGIRHMDDIAEACPGQPLLGGVARIEATLDAEGRIVHLTPYSHFTYGRYRNVTDERLSQLADEIVEWKLLKEHADIRRDLWTKYSFIAVLSGLTTLFEATVGEIRSLPYGMDTFARLSAEVAETIRRAGGSLADDVLTRQLDTIRTLSENSTSSMLRDLLAGLPTEHEHIHGYLLDLARSHGVETPLLAAVYQRLKLLESRRVGRLLPSAPDV